MQVRWGQFLEQMVKSTCFMNSLIKRLPKSWSELFWLEWSSEFHCKNLVHNGKKIRYRKQHYAENYLSKVYFCESVFFKTVPNFTGKISNSKEIKAQHFDNCNKTLFFILSLILIICKTRENSIWYHSIIYHYLLVSENIFSLTSWRFLIHYHNK